MFNDKFNLEVDGLLRDCTNSVGLASKGGYMDSERKSWDLMASLGLTSLVTVVRYAIQVAELIP